MRGITEQSLTNVAVFYLRRFGASRKGLTQMLERRVKQHIRREQEGDFETAKPIIAKIVERMVADGYVDDAKLAEAKTESLHRQGKSVRVIRMKLRQKGIGDEQIAKSTVSDPEREYEAALTLVKRKKLGTDPDRKQKDIGVLMRAGFGWDVIKRALAAPK